MSPSLKVSPHIDGLSKEIDWKTFIFSVNLGMETPQIDCLRKMSPVLRVSTLMFGFQGDRWDSVHFSSKHKHGDLLNQLSRKKQVLF